MKLAGRRPIEFVVGRLTGRLALLVAFRGATALASPEQTEVDDARRIVDDEAGRVEQGGFGHAFGALSLGRGLRTNNPYRLERVLGDSPEGLSLSALYLDLAAGYLLGDPRGIEHGPNINFSVAVTGIRQEVLTPGYRALIRLGPRWAPSVRVGVPIVLEPDLSAGAELGVGGIFRILSGIAAYAELIGSAFFGAATYDADTTVIPIVSLQLGIWMDYEVLP